ncbi:hypothetical protein [Cellulomonas shaoxiangyii]|uniref:Uncharacterized protein n=1 Tax=Cellulomonas shaoxiangyii TaxID=2566013 RepID=A0A4P7SHN5_9CELL|nr:hypothetical protein [Cellulomonas shaoxiangyii]QCB93729.1 hypothetical protein E5225_09320 [Cellulomonas shaoxiangyii]TGY81121.1 hypothetical protein E5226_14695 [Cellulomonas shaoxiangyii]
MSRSRITRPETRIIPRAGGHVTVRVEGFHEGDAVLPRPDRLGRFKVEVARDEQGLRLLDAHRRPIGRLGASWSRTLGDELAACERDGVVPVVRASLVGPRGERDMFVLLAWPSRRTAVPTQARPVRTAVGASASGSGGR